MEMVGLEFDVKRIVTFDGEGALKAYCDLAISEAVLIKGLRVVSGKHGLFVSMPRQQGRDKKWYDSVVLLKDEAKDEISRAVMDAYAREISANGSG